MENVWSRFENIASTEEVNAEKEKFKPIDAGDYEAVLEELKADVNKDGLPMIKGKFRTTTNRVLFYNQNLQNLNYPNMTAVNIADAVGVIDAITGEEIPYTGLADLAERVDAVQTGGTYSVRVSYGKNDFDMKFPKIKVLGEAETASGETGFLNIPDGIDEELPFN
jgi:hypothetical protein